ncbi:MAG TPA: GAF domain-containing protein, partial [Leptolinea sp.]
MAEAISNISQSKYIRDLHIRGKKKDGSEFLLEINAQHILDSDKNPFGVLILTRDISNQLEMLQAEEKERKLSSALISSTALLSSTLNLDDVLEKILELADQVVPHDSANIMLISGQEVHVVRARGYKTQELHNFTMSVSTRVEDFPSMVQMINNGLPMVISDTNSYPGWQTSPGFAWIHSYIGAPLRVKGQVIGVINLDSGKPGFYREEDAARLQAFADLAASAIANANLYEALQEKAAEATSLFKAATGLLSAGGDVVALARQITKTVHQDFSTAHVAILLINEASGKLEQIAQAGYLSEQTHPFDLEDSTGLAVAAIKTRQPIYIENVKQDPRFICDSPVTQSEFDIPFIIGKKVIGVLNLESPEINGFNERARKVMLTFAERAAAALENARLIERLQKREFQMTLINQLTQISLKTGNFKEMLEKQVKVIFDNLSPDGVVISFSHSTIRKLTDGYALTANDSTTNALNEIIKNREINQRLAESADVV